jgi:hypothetical protein
MTSTPVFPTAVPEEYAALVDDAAIFPPGSLPLAEAVQAHRRFAGSEHAALVGRFVVDDRRLGDLAASGAGAELALALVVTGGAGALQPSVRRAVDTPGLVLAQVETALRDLDDLPAAARRVATAAEAADLGDVPVYVEVPWAAGVGSYGWLSALDVLGEADLRAKLRTGGAADVPVPDAADLAAAVDAALDRELRFKCTGGLHHAVRGVGGPGTAQHGFLNVLLAVAAAWDGAPVADVAALLERTDEAEVAAMARDATLAPARRWFTSFGSCSVAEPLEDLTRLGLLP